MRNHFRQTIFFLIAVSCSPANYADDISISDAALKAIFLERFTRFIDWPTQQNINTENVPFTITVMGDKPFAKLLRKVYKTKKIQNKLVIVNEDLPAHKLFESHIVFIAKSEKRRVSSILKHIEKHPVLTVSDTPGNAQKGVIINLFNSAHRMRFEINTTAVSLSNLHMSFKLLSQAVIVEPTLR